MARKREEITVRSGIMVNGKFTSIKDLSEKERAEWRQRSLDRIGKTVGSYYNSHPEELRDFLNAPEAHLEPT